MPNENFREANLIHVSRIYFARPIMILLSINLVIWRNEREESGGWEPLWPHAHSSVAPIKRATLISTTRSDPAVISFSRAPAVYKALSLSPFSPLLVPPPPSRFASTLALPHAHAHARTRARRDLAHRPRIFVFVNKWTLIVQCDIVA